MTTLVHYSLQNNIATIGIDDGKRNALSPAVLHELYQALDQAESDHAAIILTGRESVFSAGFDLKIMKRGGFGALNMLRLGYSRTLDGHMSIACSELVRSVRYGFLNLSTYRSVLPRISGSKTPFV